MKHTYTVNDLVFNTCAAINDTNSPYIEADFKTLSEAFLGCKNPELEPCKGICIETLEKLPKLARKSLEPTLVSILVELFKLKPEIVLRKACGRSRQILQEEGLI